MATATESFFADRRYSGRKRRKSPAFTLVTVLLVSLGTGAVNTSELFSIDREHRNGIEGMSASYSFYEQIRDQTHSFDGVAAWKNIALTITSG